MFIPLWLLILLAVWFVVACSGHEEQRQHCDELQDRLDNLEHHPDPEVLRDLW